MAELLLHWEDNETVDEYLTRCERLVKADPDNRSLLMEYADALINVLTFGIYRYSDQKQMREDTIFTRYEKTVERMIPESSIHSAIRDVIAGNYSSVIADIKSWLDLGTSQLQNNEFVFSLLLPLKDGFSGMWLKIGELLTSYDVQDGLPELCAALEVVYHSGDNERIVDALSEVIRKNKEVYVATELLGYTYYQMKMWKNAAACFSGIADNEDIVFFFPLEDIFFWLAWAYGQSKKLIEEESCYRKSLAINPDGDNTLNNLGYCLYKQKRFDEAKIIFEDLIKQQHSLPYAPNNLMRVLLAMGQYESAVSFANTYDGKISKDLVKRASELRLQKGASVSVPVFTEIPVTENDDETQELPKCIDIGIKREQFTSEKLLEDELTLRMERGYGAFGLPLSIYEKKGEYGRQYIIPVGRIDILAVDADENLYVIELKKDSGYDDAYTQTVGYIRWIEEHMIKKDRKVYGVICLNNPSAELIGKVKSDPQVRLYEYAISYTEIT